MERLFYKELVEWKNEYSDIPLMVVGARQIGKTYIIDEFCKKEFENYIYINLFEREDLIKLFKTEISFDEKMKKFKLMIGTELTSNTIIFFDEIQESEDLISMLKPICESSDKYKVICAGSLLGVKLKRFKKSFPVGKVLIKHMYPMTFEEFLINTKGKTIVEDIYSAYENNEPLIDVLHEELIELYRIFLCIGGFPAAINEYIRRGSDIIKYNPMIIDSIYQSYLADLNKYVENKTEAAHNEKVYRSIPSQLGKENKKFQYAVIEKGGRKNKFESSLDWLIASGIVIPVYFAGDNQIPLKASQDDDTFKIFFNDSGLLTRVSETAYSQIILDEDFRFKGAIAENYVACELLANGHSLYYWFKSQTSEIDLMIDGDKYPIPIEIKSSREKKSTSLNYYMANKNYDIAYRISTKNFGFDNNIKSIPLYAVFCIKKETWKVDSNKKH